MKFGQKKFLEIDLLISRGFFAWLFFKFSGPAAVISISTVLWANHNLTRTEPNSNIRMPPQNIPPDNYLNTKQNV